LRDAVAAVAAAAAAAAPRCPVRRSSKGGIAGCSVDTQKKFIRSYMDEVYLWYREIPEVDAAKFSTVEDYFHALLVKTPDVNGLPKDRFSAVLPVSLAQAVPRRPPRSSFRTPPRCGRPAPTPCPRSACPPPPAVA
jgi:hypothetical protein